MRNEVKPEPATDEEIEYIMRSLMRDNGCAYLSIAERDCISLIARIEQLKAQSELSKEIIHEQARWIAELEARRRFRPNHRTPVRMS